MPLNSKITYLYRDASNYKFWGEFKLRGEITFEEITPYLLQGSWFIPARLDLKCIVPESQNSDDHELHEFFQIEPTTDEDCIFDKAEFIARLKHSADQGWFIPFGSPQKW